jgi:hypothetical protein
MNLGDIMKSFDELEFIQYQEKYALIQIKKIIF